YAVALASIRSKRNGLATNSILLKYYNENMNGKSKKVGLVAVMKKLLVYIFSILKNQKAYEIRTPELHCKMYVENQYLQVA
ncbi:MAG: hypothetical protein ACRC76_00120, partial [Proteocatella sp.]